MAPTVMVTTRKRGCSSQAVLDLVLVAILVLLLLPMATASDGAKSLESDPTDWGNVKAFHIQSGTVYPQLPTIELSNGDDEPSAPDITYSAYVDQLRATYRMLRQFVTEMQNQFGEHCDPSTNPQVPFCATLMEMHQQVIKQASDLHVDDVDYHLVKLAEKDVKEKEEAIKRYQEGVIKVEEYLEAMQLMYRKVVETAKSKLDSKLAQSVELKSKWVNLRDSVNDTERVKVDQLCYKVDSLLMAAYQDELKSSVDGSGHLTLSDELTELESEISALQAKYNPPMVANPKKNLACCVVKSVAGAAAVAGALALLLYSFNSNFYDWINGKIGIGQVIGTTPDPGPVTPWTTRPTTEALLNLNTVLLMGSILLSLVVTTVIAYYFLVYRKRTTTRTSTSDVEADGDQDDDYLEMGVQESSGKDALTPDGKSKSRSRSKSKSVKDSATGTSPTDTLATLDKVKSKSKSKSVKGNATSTSPTLSLTNDPLAIPAGVKSRSMSKSKSVKDNATATSPKDTLATSDGVVKSKSKPKSKSIKGNATSPTFSLTNDPLTYGVKSRSMSKSKSVKDNATATSPKDTLATSDGVVKSKSKPKSKSVKGNATSPTFSLTNDPLAYGVKSRSKSKSKSTSNRIAPSPGQSSEAKTAGTSSSSTLDTPKSKSKSSRSFSF